MYAPSPTHPVGHSLPIVWGQHAAELIARGAASLAREIRIRRDLRRLSGLNDAMLRDIGIARGGLESAVRFGRTTEQPVTARKP